MAVRARVCAILHKWQSKGYLPPCRLRHVHFFFQYGCLGKCGQILSKLISFLWVFFRFHKGLKKSRTNLPKDDYADSLFFQFQWLGQSPRVLSARQVIFRLDFFYEGRLGIYTIFITKTILCK